PCPAGDAVRRRHAHEVPGSIVFGEPGERADLIERARVHETADALADREATFAMLAIHLLGAAHFLREVLALSQLVELALPSPRRRHATHIVLGHSPHSPAAAPVSRFRSSPDLGTSASLSVASLMSPSAAGQPHRGRRVSALHP